MSGGFPPYEAPDLFDADGVALVVEEEHQQEWFGSSSMANNNNAEEMEVEGEAGGYDGQDNSNGGGVDFDLGLLCQSYVQLQRAAEAYLRTGHAALTRLQQKRQREEQYERSLRCRAEFIASTALSPNIKLNIGGMRFHVQRDTLLQFSKYSMTLFDFLDGEKFIVQKDEFGYVFVDRDPWLFRELLFLLRERRERIAMVGQGPPLLQGGVEYERLARLPLAEQKRVMEEARYYGLNELVAELQVKRHQWQKCVFMPASAVGCATSGDVISHSSLDGDVLLHRGEEGWLRPPEACCFAACVRLHDSVYLFGGCGEQEVIIDSLYRLQLDRNSSEECSETQQEHEEGQANSGLGAASIQCVRFDKMEPFVDDVGQTTPAVPGARSGHAMVTFQGRYLLLFYGNNLSSHLKDVWVYHAARNVWSPVKLRGSPVEPRSGHTVTVVRDRLYLIGGKTLFGSMRRLLAEVFEGRFDAGRQELTWRLVSWQQQQQQPSSYMSRFAVAESDDEEGEGPCSLPPTAYHSSVEYGGRYVILFGGLREPPNRHRDGREGQRNSMTPGAAAADISATPTEGGVPLCVYKFDTLECTWCRLCTSLDSSSLAWSDIPKSGHIAVRCHSDMYVMGSYALQQQQELSLLQLSLQSLVWRRIQTTVAPTQSPPCGRAAPCGVLLPSSAYSLRPVILLYGGYNVELRQYFNDAYIVTL
ncbi:hypothetical protein DQ04_00891090 [Trypanosoma grayi]|uniref:hypothetical protein n=1 Tax=Trypanosoma grayi TaxID=71804 RepID=UPI0004F45CFA|nr:hypothetical protein DQ04_00891090 [Trypanosoma grayi]KEG13626.1 hypothetical protein DQ04_00891090 [Trypanosoma grayi]